MGSGATTDRERLLRVAQSLAEAAAQPTAARPADHRRRLPVVQAQDAAGLIAMMHEQLDQAIERRSADVAETGVVIACQRGCHACCYYPVVTSEAEAVAVAQWLIQPENSLVRERFLAAYPAWRAAHGATIEALVATDSKDDRVRACADYFSQRGVCPFNHDGDCTIYPVRPALCRITHAVGSSEKCEEGIGVATVSHPEVDATYDSQGAMRATLNEALRPGRSVEALPKSVMRRLTGATAFPNQPCPCGSGLKQKRCCRG
jgi:Fe-S-cluster containining protein